MVLQTDPLLHSSMTHSSFCELKIDLAEDQDTPINHFLYKINKDVEYPWAVFCYPRGLNQANDGEYVSLRLSLGSHRRIRIYDVVFEAFVMGKNGAHTRELRRVGTLARARSVQWDRFVKRSDLEQFRGTTGVVTLVCGVLVFRNNPLTVPDSNIVNHLEGMLDCADGSDVSFSVGGKTFHAHRAVLAAARSAVFKAELFGSMAEAQMSCITLHEIEPTTFEIMLRFIYTDALPTDRELGDNLVDVFQHLLAAADRYALDRLKLLCAQRILDNMSVDTVAIVLDCSLMYNCPELKERCMDFFVAEANFKKAVLTENFVRLGQKFPSIIAELRKKAEA